MQEKNREGQPENLENETSQIEVEPAIKQGWLRVLLFFVSWIIIFGILQAIGTVLLVFISGIELSELAEFRQNIWQRPSWLLFLNLFGFLGTLIAVGIYRKFIDRKSFLSLGFSVKNRAKDMVGGFLLGFFLIFLGFIILKLTGFLVVTGVNFDPTNMVVYFVFLTIVAFNEEIVVRGYILNNLMDSMNQYLALAVAAVLFAGLHFFNPNNSILSVVNLIIAGFVLGITYIHTKNLWFPIFLHFSWNFFQGPIFGFEVSGVNLKGVIEQEISGNKLITGGAFGFEGSIILTILSIIIIVILDRIYKNSQERAIQTK